MSNNTTPRLRKNADNVSVDTLDHLKRTILDYDPNGTYIEENDSSFIEISSDPSSDDDEVLQENPSDFSELSDSETIGTQSKLIDSHTIAGSSQKDSSATSKENEIIKAKQGFKKVKAFIVKHEIIRKALHLSIGVFTLWLYTLGFHHTQIILPMVTLFLIIFTNDFIRLRNPELNAKICKTWWFLFRETERYLYNGTLYFLAGLIIAFSLAPKDISIMSVLLLSWSDTAALTIGRAYGKYTPKITAGKLVAGSLASFVTGVFACYVLYGYFIPKYLHLNAREDILWTESLSKISLPVYALLLGIIASVSEFIDLGGLDDNFTIPVLSMGFLYGVVKLFQL